MNDPLSDILSLLKPEIIQAKLAEATGSFRVRREDVKDMYYCMVLEGSICLDVDGKEPQVLNSGDFALIPSINCYTVTSMPPPANQNLLSSPKLESDGVYRLGEMDSSSKVKQLMGYCRFLNPDEIVLSMLPEFVVVSGEQKLITLATMIRDEIYANRPARFAMTKSLLRALLIEAFRSSSDFGSRVGLLNGLSNPHISRSLHAIHTKPEFAWTVSQLANEAGMSRSSFFSKFGRLIGVTPMEYLVNWRMMMAKNMLNEARYTITEIADKIGYSSPSAFSTAFTRNLGYTPTAYRNSLST